MVDVKHFKDASQDIAEDFGALREDVAKLNLCVHKLRVPMPSWRGPKVPGSGFPVALPRRKIGSAAWARILRPRLSATPWQRC